MWRSLLGKSLILYFSLGIIKFLLPIEVRIVGRIFQKHPKFSTTKKKTPWYGITEEKTTFFCGERTSRINGRYWLGTPRNSFLCHCLFFKSSAFEGRSFQKQFHWTGSAHLFCTIALLRKEKITFQKWKKQYRS